MAYYPMYGINLIRRVPGSAIPEVLTKVEPDARKLSEAIARGKRVFPSRRAEAQIDGFRVIERMTGEPYFWYYDDPDHVFAEDGERLPL
jgi:hypothetical protein